MMKEHTRIVRKLFSSPEFHQAWKDSGEAGLGSVMAAKKVEKLLCESKYHSKRLNDISLMILDSAADWADKEPSQEAIQELHFKLLSSLCGVAAAFTVMGAVVGFATCLNFDQKNAATDASQDGRCESARRCRTVATHK